MSNKRLTGTGRFASAFAVLLAASLAQGQTVANPKPKSNEVDLAVGFNAFRQTGIPRMTFWQKGIYAELSAEAWRGFGTALLLTEQSANNVNGSGVNVNTVTLLCGPRYTFRRKHLAVFAEGLAGESNAFNGVYPSSGGAQSSSAAFAANANGGVDVSMQKHLSVRLFQAGWQYTQFPNGTTNAQNALMLGGGVVFRLQR